MQNDELLGEVDAMLDSEDELTVTVAELWQRVQFHHRQLQALEERLRQMSGPGPPGTDSG